MKPNNIDSVVIQKSLIPLMNNKKWVKLLNCLVCNFIEIKECKVKLIWEAENKRRNLKIDEFISYQHDYYEHSTEGMISGNPKGWYDYKEIEWIEFPKIINSGLEQDLKKIQNLITQIGKFELSIDDNSLRVFAYLSSNRKI